MGNVMGVGSSGPGRREAFRIATIWVGVLSVIVIFLTWASFTTPNFFLSPAVALFACLGCIVLGVTLGVHWVYGTHSERDLA